LHPHPQRNPPPAAFPCGVGAGSALLQLFEAVRQLERLGVEECELLLDGDREVLSVLERLMRRANLLVRRQPLRIAHVASVSEGTRAPARRSPSSSPPRLLCEPPRRAPLAPPARGRATQSASSSGRRRRRSRSSRGDAAPAGTPLRDLRRPQPGPSVGQPAAATRLRRPPRRPSRTPPGRSTARPSRPRAAAGARG